jgi:XTP/dITP diphosphohydrolase
MTRTFSSGELVVATHNKGKMAEFRHLFGNKVKNLYSAADFNLEAPAETGTTFIENALIKAKFVAAATGKIALADDSGLCVDALGGAPGVYSADWAEEEGKPRDFRMAMDRVHKEMGNAPDKKAHFVSVLALCWPDGHCEVVEGFAHGQIVWPPRGPHGHGYDPIFMPDGYTQTYGEMGEDAKNRISHRAQSFQLMIKKLFNNK